MLWASGDLAGGIAAMEHALAILPPGPSQPRARALATLAQHLMLDGRFAESAALAEQARDVAEAVGPAARPELAHALCTLGVDIAWQGSLDQGLALLQGVGRGRPAGGSPRRPDARRPQPDHAARPRCPTRAGARGRDRRASATPRPAGWVGPTARSCAATPPTSCTSWADGRSPRPSAGSAWSGSRRGSRGSAPRCTWASCSSNRAPTTRPRTSWARRCCSWTPMPAGQWTALVQRAAVSYRPVARAGRGCARRSPDGSGRGCWRRRTPGQIALAASTCLEAAAEAAEDGRARRDVGLVAEATELAALVLPEAERQVADRVAAAQRWVPGRRPTCTWGWRARIGVASRVVRPPGPGRASPRPGRSGASRTRLPRHAGGRRSPSFDAAVATGRPRATRSRKRGVWPVGCRPARCAPP